MLPALATGISALVFSLGGVPVSVGSSFSVLPAQPDPAHMELVWPTSQMALNVSVRMADGSRWQVPRVPVRLANGSIALKLKAANSPSAITFTVPADQLDIPIWVVGELPPQGETVETNEPTEGPIDVEPVPTGTPTTVPTPTETPEPPAEG